MKLSEEQVIALYKCGINLNHSKGVSKQEIAIYITKRINEFLKVLDILNIDTDLSPVVYHSYNNRLEKR